MNGRRKLFLQLTDGTVIVNPGLADAKDFLTNLLTRSQPGAQKLQFPYEIPPIETVITIDPDTKKILYTVTGTIVGGVIVNTLIKKFL